MKGIGSLLLNIAVALYLFANGILGLTKGTFGARSGEFANIAGTIFKGDLANLVTLILSVIALVAGVLLILQLFRIAIPSIDLLMFIIVIVWVVFIVIVDIINPIGKGLGNLNLITYLVQLASHLMVLGALLTASKRFG